MRMSSTLKIALSFVLFFVIGVFAAKLYEQFLPSFKQQFYKKSSLYETPDKQLLTRFAETEKTPISWSDLLPQDEREALEDYKEPSEEEFIRQITEAMQAATDRSYRPPPSVNIVEELVGRAISIPGFIVPIDINEDKTIRSYFLVPYYGACIHYPPPPPNQMIFVELIDGFSELDIRQPYTIEGFLGNELFEDPLGTSAYVLDAVRIEKFYGQPDDAREH